MNFNDYYSAKKTIITYLLDNNCYAIICITVTSNEDNREKEDF
jgi:hypothetical protein